MISAMQLVDELVIERHGAKRAIQLFIGDLTAIPETEAVDLLVVSAFPGNYRPTRTSLIGALAAIQVSVAALASNKAVDLRENSSCWLSQEIRTPGVNFRRLLCFEPAIRGAAPELVGDIFRSLIPFAVGPPALSKIAMPIVAAGDQGESPTVMLECILEAALHWLSVGMPVDCIKIVDRNAGNEKSLRAVFDRVREHKALLPAVSSRRQWKYDAFVSYSRSDKVAANALVEALLRANSSLCIFVDQMELQAGAAWQQHIFEALDDCGKVIAMLSPGYLSSKVCKEEFNIALFRHRESQCGVLLPVYLRTAVLPTYMKLIQFEDAREGDAAKVAAVATKIASVI